MTLKKKTKSIVCLSVLACPLVGFGQQDMYLAMVTTTAPVLAPMIDDIPTWAAEQSLRAALEDFYSGYHWLRKNTASIEQTTKVFDKAGFESALRRIGIASLDFDLPLGYALKNGSIPPGRPRRNTIDPNCGRCGANSAASRRK